MKRNNVVSFFLFVVLAVSSIIGPQFLTIFPKSIPIIQWSASFILGFIIVFVFRKGKCSDSLIVLLIFGAGIFLAGLFIWPYEFNKGYLSTAWIQVSHWGFAGTINLSLFFLGAGACALHLHIQRRIRALREQF